MNSLYNFFVSDLVRIYRLLDSTLQRRVLLQFARIFVLGNLEAVTILSISFLAMSIASPQNTLTSPFMRVALHYLPFADLLRTDPRYIVLFISSVVVLIMVLRNAFSAYATISGSELSEEIGYYTGNKLLTHYLHKGYIWHLGKETQTIIRALNRRRMPSQTMLTLMNIYTYIFVSFMMFLLLISATPLTVITTLIVVGALASIIYRSLRHKIDFSGKLTEASQRKETQAIENARNGIREIIIYQQQAAFLTAFKDACRISISGRAFLNIAHEIPKWILEVLGFAMIPVSVFIMVFFYDAPSAEMAGVLTMLLLACWRVLPLFSRTVSLSVGLKKNRLANQECLEILEKCTDLNQPGCDTARGFSFQHSICLNDVTFRYETSGRNILQNVSMRIPQGSHIGIIGASGAGKSTLVNILSGLISPDSGALLVDGKELKEAELSAYRRKIGYVPQTPYIMAGTVATNVAFSEWGKEPDEARVRRACDMAALDIIHTHPKGIFRPVGGGGAGISGGQIQRIAIARALYTEPDILLMDEATSSLDLKTEAEITETINSLQSSLTVVTIAHRLTTVENCQQLYVIEEGKIVGHGTPKEILGKYKNNSKQRYQPNKEQI